MTCASTLRVGWAEAKSPDALIRREMSDATLSYGRFRFRNGQGFESPEDSCPRENTGFSSIPPSDDNLVLL